MLPTPMATLQLDSFLIKLYRLGRRQLDVSVLSIGTQIARRTGSLLFWVIIGFFAFFLFLALNIAAGFALASSFDESPPGASSTLLWAMWGLSSDAPPALLAAALGAAGRSAACAGACP